MKFNSNQKLLFFILFVVFGLLALQVPLVRLAGSKAQFTLFDSFGPIASGFLGTIPGIIAVFIMQFSNFLIHGARVLDAGTLIRFLPMIFAAIYFGKKNKLNLIVPILAIISFNLNPVGRSVWFFSLFWLIPIFCYPLQDKFVLARSLGATFTAHAVGGALWIWFFHLPSAVWIGLIPVVIIERSIFAVGMALNYIVLRQLLKLTIVNFSSIGVHEVN